MDNQQPVKKYARQAKWKAQHKKTITFDLYENNQDMIDWLNQQSSIAGYIKDLIRADMGRKQGTNNAAESF